MKHERGVTLGLVLLILEGVLAAYLLAFRFWDARMQDHLALVSTGDICAEIEMQWRTQPGTVPGRHQIKFKDVRYVIEGDKLIKIKNNLPETMLVRLDPGHSGFEANGDVLKGQLQIRLVHDRADYPLYARGLK